MTLLKDIVPSCRLEELINNSYFFSDAMAKAADGNHSNSNSANSIHEQPFSAEGCGENVQEDWKDGSDDAP